MEVGLQFGSYKVTSRRQAGSGQQYVGTWVLYVVDMDMDKGACCGQDPVSPGTLRPWNA